MSYLPFGITSDLTRKAYPPFCLALILLFCVTFPIFAASPAKPPQHVVVSYQENIGFLPLMVMQDKQLFEKHAEALGINLSVDYALVPDKEIPESISSGAVQIIGSSVTAFADIWSAHNGFYKKNYKAISGLSSFPYILTSNNPNVKSLADFKEGDRIAISEKDRSLPAQILMMAQEQIFATDTDRKINDKLKDRLVSMTPYDGMRMLIARKNGITAHFVSPPSSYHELAQKNIHSVFSSETILGASSTSELVYCSTSFYTSNPKIIKAFNLALSDAIAFIKHENLSAISIYRKLAVDAMPVDLLQQVLNDPKIQFTTELKNVMKMIEFRYKVGLIKDKPKKAKEVFFENEAIKNPS